MAWLSAGGRLSLVIAVSLPHGGIRGIVLYQLAGVWSGSNVGGVRYRQGTEIGGKWAQRLPPFFGYGLRWAEASAVLSCCK